MNTTSKVYSYIHLSSTHVFASAAQTKKKKKKVMPVKSKPDSRSSSGVKAKRTKGIQATPEGSAAANKKRGKSAKKRGAAGKGKGVSTGTDADPPIIERENTALISGEQGTFSCCFAYFDKDSGFEIIVVLFSVN